MGLHFSIINATIVTYQVSPTATSTLCFGKPNVLTEIDNEFIDLPIKREPYITIWETCQALDKSVPTDTCSRMLKEYGYTQLNAWKGYAIKWVIKPTQAIQ